MLSIDVSSPNMLELSLLEGENGYDRFEYEFITNIVTLPTQAKWSFYSRLFSYLTEILPDFVAPLRPSMFLLPRGISDDELERLDSGERHLIEVREEGLSLVIFCGAGTRFSRNRDGFPMHLLEVNNFKEDLLKPLTDEEELRSHFYIPSVSEGVVKIRYGEIGLIGKEVRKFTSVLGDHNLFFLPSDFTERTSVFLGKDAHALVGLDYRTLFNGFNPLCLVEEFSHYLLEKHLDRILEVGDPNYNYNPQSEDFYGVSRGLITSMYNKARKGVRGDSSSIGVQEKPTHFDFSEEDVSAVGEETSDIDLPLTYAQPLHKDGQIPTLKQEQLSLNFVFRNFEDVISCVARLPVESSYLYHSEGRFYLQLKGLSKDAYYRCIPLLAEYGDRAKRTEVFIRDYGKCLMEGNAIEQLKNYFWRDSKCC